MYSITMRLSGEYALLLELQQQTSPSIDSSMPAKLQQLATWCTQLCGDAVQDIVPAYHTLLLSFSPYHARWPGIIDELEHACKRWQIELSASSTVLGRLWQLPVWYDSAVGADLATVAKRHQLSMVEVAKRHSAIDYPVYAVGFTVGFAYLGFVDETLATPRHRTPRLAVPAGSVAIADRQTAVYPSATPGGWNLIGQCPIPLRHDWCQVGDRIRFVAVDAATFAQLQQQPALWQMGVCDDASA